MLPRLLLGLCALGLLLPPAKASADGNVLQPIAEPFASAAPKTVAPLPEASLPAATPTPEAAVPAALQEALSKFAWDELLANQHDDPTQVARFYTFPLDDDGQTVNATQFKSAYTEFIHAYRHREFGKMDAPIKFVRYDPAADIVELQQSYGSVMQAAGHPDSEKRLSVRQLKVIHAGQESRAIVERFTVKRYWTYETRLSEADHFQPGQPPQNLATDISYPGGVRSAVNAIIAQDRINYYSGRPDGRDPDDEPCSYFNDTAHRDLLLKARLHLIPDTQETLDAILNGHPRVRVAFSDNLHGENIDGHPILNVGLVGK